MTAQDRFREVLRSSLAPALRDHGFAGSGQDFSRRFGHEWAVVNVQRSRSSSADEVHFTVNLGVACPAALAEDGIPEDVAPPEVLCHSRVRIGQLLPGGRDTWWTIGSATSERDATSLGATLTALVAAYILPALEQMADHEAILAAAGAAPPFVGLHQATMDIAGPILRAISDEARFTAYLAALDDAEPALSLYSFHSVANRRPSSAAIDQALRKLATSGRLEPRYAALELLSRASPDDRIVAAVRDVLDDADPRVRRAAALAIGRLRDDDSALVLARLIDADPARDVACAAAIAASALRPTMSATDRAVVARAIDLRRARAVGHDRPLLNHVAGVFEAAG